MARVHTPRWRARLLFVSLLVGLAFAPTQFSPACGPGRRSARRIDADRQCRVHPRRLRLDGRGDPRHRPVADGRGQGGDARGDRPDSPSATGSTSASAIYGHEGSNGEADRDVSCAATELLRADRRRRPSELYWRRSKPRHPTGWTPLALALEEAAGDFCAGGESVTNAVIMVTDGEETCGGDPCAVAGAHDAADIELTTHVVGFALTPEQNRAVRCIAEEGGGQLFTADDADSLGDAVFSRAFPGRGHPGAGRGRDRGRSRRLRRRQCPLAPRRGRGRRTLRGRGRGLRREPPADRYPEQHG